MEPETIINLIMAAITAATAIAAIVISVIQISKSNKQSLFDRRLNAFLKVKWMAALCDENQKLYKSYVSDANKGPVFDMDCLFGWLTNNAFLEDIQLVIKHPLDFELQKKYLSKMEELRNLCEEVRLIFPESIGYPMADFLFNFEELLVAMYKYQVAFESISKSCEQTNRPFPENNDLEAKCRQRFLRYLNGTFGYSEKLNKEGVLEKAKARIKL